MLIIFSVNDQKITHDLKGQLVAGSVDIVQAAFKFDSSWDELDKIVVFTSSACPKPVPVQFADEAFYIPKDMVVKSGSVVTNPTGQPKGTYIKLVLANATNDTLYIDVGGLIEYVTSGSAAGDMVVIAIDEQTHKVTASITDGAITKAKLETEVQTALNKAHEHTNKALLDTYDQTNANIKDAVSKKHSHANAEENVIVSIQRNGQAIAPDNKVVNIEVPTKTSALENDSGYATTEDVEEKVNGAGHLKAVPVDDLPAPSEANADTIYFLRKNNSEAGKQYRAYKLIHGIFEIVGSAEVDLTGYATQESVAKADDNLIKGIYNNMTASSEKYLGSGNLLLFWTLLKSLLNGHESSINDLLARVKLLELILSADVTGNPYYVTFNTLTDVVVSSGIWNESDGRIEF